MCELGPIETVVMSTPEAFAGENDPLAHMDDIVAGEPLDTQVAAL